MRQNLRKALAVFSAALLSTVPLWSAPQSQAPDPDKVACVQMGLLNALQISVHGDVVDLRKLGASTREERLAALKPSDLVVVDDALLSDALARNKLRESPTTLLVSSDGEAGTLATLLSMPVGMPEVFVAIPQDAVGVEKVFGPAYRDSGLNGRTVQYMSSITKSLQEIGGITRIQAQSEPSHGTIAQQVLRQAGADNKTLFVAIAHHERGRLHFADESSLTVAELHTALAAARRPGVVLACNTIDAPMEARFAAITTRELEFTEISAALKIAVKRAQCVRGGATYADFVSIMSEQLQQQAERAHRQARLYLTVIGPTLAVAVVGGAAAAVMQNPPKQDDKKKKAGTGK